MDSYAANWLSDLENMEDCDYNMFGVMKCMEYDDDQFISHDIASVVQGKYNNLQPCLSCESVTKCMSNNSSITSESGFKSSNWNHTVSEHSSSQLLSFDNSNNNNSSPSSNQFYGFNNNNNNNNESGLNPKKETMMSQIQSGDMNYCEKKGSEGGVKRGIPQVRDHIMAERKRREKLSQSFIALSALVPGLKKMDKASVLGDAIKYVKEMKEKLTILEEQNKKRRVMESVVTVKKSPICGGDDDSSSSEENVINGVGEAESLPEVEVRVSDKDVLLRIHCQKHKGILVKILAEIQNLDLFVVNSSVLPFGDSNIDVTIIAQMGEGYNLRMKDLVKNLRVAILSVCEEMNVV